jgi:hypothetical protein
LNASSLNGATFASPGAIGGTTPGTGAFTQATATRSYTNNADLQIVAGGDIAGVNIRATGKGRLSIITNYQFANTSSIQVGTADNAPNTEAIRIDHATGGVRLLTGFGCNGQAPQSAASLGAAATDLASVITLANNIRTALIANGIGS